MAVASTEKMVTTLARGSRLTWTAVALLLAVMAFNMLSALNRNSLTNDEFYHIPAGFDHLRGDFTVNSEHPPLVKILSALPLLLMPVTRPAQGQELESFPISRGHERFTQFWTLNDREFDRIAFAARVPMVLISVILGILIFLYGKRLFGPVAGLLALALYAIEPNILVHGRIVQTDLPAAVSFLLFFFCLDRFIEKRTLRAALVLGLSVGLALLIKYSMIVVAPVAAIAIVWVALKSQKPLSVGLSVGAAATATALVVINAGFGFTRQTLSAADAGWLRESGSMFASFIALSEPLFSRILPGSFLFGLGIVSAHNAMGSDASILGHYSSSGWWYYFPVCFALKTTLPFLILAVLALGWSVWKLISGRDMRFVLPLVAILSYALLCAMSRLNIGIRHMLPLFPFLFILVGAFLDRLLRSKMPRVGLAIVLVAFGWMGVEAIRAFPDYLSYTSQLTGNRPGWEFLADSNVEWGEDSGALAQYLAERGETRVEAALLGAWLTLKHHGIDYVSAFDPPRLPRPRYIAIGASALNGATVPHGLKREDGSVVTEDERPAFFSKYRDRTPERVFGGSIYLFRTED